MLSVVEYVMLTADGILSVLVLVRTISVVKSICKSSPSSPVKIGSAKPTSTTVASVGNSSNYYMQDIEFS